MGFFAYHAGRLRAEEVDLDHLAAEVGTPFYCYSRAAIETRYDAFRAHFAPLEVTICYAMKANSNQAVLRVLAKRGAGMDVVSEGELRRARAAGVPGRRITFSGVGKTDRELSLGLDDDILCFNVESEQELERLSAMARSRGTRARIAVRVNPDIDARTHAKIATGKAENKFGIPISRAREVYARASTLPGLVVTGVDMHIGSQIVELEPFDRAFAVMADFVRALRDDGHAIDHVDLGGGLGIPYRLGEAQETIDEGGYATLAKRHLGNSGVKLVLEPGRRLVGSAGVLVTRVVLVKRGENKTFVVVDAAMNDFIRPTLYEAHHEIVPVEEPDVAAAPLVADVVGPVCETGDYLALGRRLPPVRAGDLLAVLSAGAYGAVHAGTYNSRLLIPEVLVSGARSAVIRRRLGFEDLLALDRVPPWLSEPADAIAEPQRTL